MGYNEAALRRGRDEKTAETENRKMADEAAVPAAGGGVRSERAVSAGGEQKLAAVSDERQCGSERVHDGRPRDAAGAGALPRPVRAEGAAAVPAARIPGRLFQAGLFRRLSDGSGLLRPVSVLQREALRTVREEPAGPVSGDGVPGRRAAAGAVVREHRVAGGDLPVRFPAVRLLSAASHPRGPASYVPRRPRHRPAGRLRVLEQVYVLRLFCGTGAGRHHLVRQPRLVDPHPAHGR